MNSFLVDIFKKVDFKSFNTKLHLWQRNIAEFIKKHRTIKLLHLLRSYSAFAAVFSCAILVSATNMASNKNGGGILFGYWDSEAQADVSSNKISGQINKKNDLALVPLSKSNTSIDPEMKEEEIDQSMITDQGVLSSYGGSPIRDPEEDGGVKVYTVAEGETLSEIAAKNHITINTILWANDIGNVDSIKPGDTIFILPVSGIKYIVKAGDNIESIANKFKADKERIIAFNDLPANGGLETGKEIVIPDGQGEKPVSSQQPSSGLERRQYAGVSGGSPQIGETKGITGSDGDDGKAGRGHRFPYGYCTWFVAQKRYVPWGGNAGTWLYHAKAAGYATGKTPKVGSIVVTTENRYYGHVAYVEKVSGSTITVSEMNYVGFAKKSVRTISTSSRAIKGYIY